MREREDDKFFKPMVQGRGVKGFWFTVQGVRVQGLGNFRGATGKKKKKKKQPP